MGSPSYLPSLKQIDTLFIFFGTWKNFEIQVGRNQNLIVISPVSHISQFPEPEPAGSGSRNGDI